MEVNKLASGASAAIKRLRGLAVQLKDEQPTEAKETLLKQLKDGTDSHGRSCQSAAPRSHVDKRPRLNREMLHSRLIARPTRHRRAERQDDQAPREGEAEARQGQGRYAAGPAGVLRR